MIEDISEISKMNNSIKNSDISPEIETVKITNNEFFSNINKKYIDKRTKIPLKLAKK